MRLYPTRMSVSILFRFITFAGDRLSNRVLFLYDFSEGLEATRPRDTFSEETKGLVENVPYPGARYTGSCHAYSRESSNKSFDNPFHRYIQRHPLRSVLSRLSCIRGPGCMQGPPNPGEMGIDKGSVVGRSAQLKGGVGHV